MTAERPAETVSEEVLQAQERTAAAALSSEALAGQVLAHIDTVEPREVAGAGLMLNHLIGGPSADSFRHPDNRARAVHRDILIRELVGRISARWPSVNVQLAPQERKDS